MNEDLIPIVFTNSECEMLITLVTSFIRSVKQSCPAIVNDPDFKKLVNISVGIERGLEDSIRVEKEGK